MREKNYLTVFALLIALSAFAYAVQPTISSFTVSPKFAKADTTLALTIAATDANKMRFSCDGSNWTVLEDFSGTKQILISALSCGSDGDKNITAKIISADLNETIARDSLSFDTEKPAITINTPSGATVTNWVSFDINDFTSGVNSSTVLIKVNSNSATASNGTCQSIGANYHCDGNLAAINQAGSYTITVDASDSAGNPATQASISSLTYADDVAPGQVTGLAASIGNNQAVLNWTASSAFDLNNYFIYLGTDAAFETTSQTLIAAIPAGTTTFTATDLSSAVIYYFKASANDKSGNEGLDSSIASADNTASTGSISAPAYTRIATPTLSLIASLGTALMRFSCDNLTWTSSISFAGSYASFAINSGSNGCSSAEGQKTIYVQYSKNGSIWGSYYNASTIFDATAPSVSISNPPTTSTATINSTIINFTYGGTDSSGIKRYYVKLDSGSWFDMNTENSRIFSDLTTGSHTLYVKAMDNAENESPEYTASFNVSTSTTTTTTTTSTGNTTLTSGSGGSVKVSWFEPSNNSTVYGIARLKVKASSSYGIKSINFYYGSKLIARVTSKDGEYYVTDWNTFGLKEPSYVLTAAAYDNINNSIMDVITVKVSKTPLPAAGEATPSESFESIEGELEKLVEESGDYGISLSSYSTSIKSNLLKELDAARKLLNDQNTALLEKNIEKASALLQELKQNFSIELVKSEETSFDQNKIEELLKTALDGVVDTNLAKALILTEECSPERIIQVIKVHDSDSNYYVVSVVLKLKNNSKTKQALNLIEVVPKSFAENSDLLKSVKEFTVSKQDPVIVFELSLNSGESAEFSYYLNKKFTDKNSALLLVSEEIIKAFNTPPIITLGVSKPKAVSTQKSQSSTGFLSLADSQSLIIIAAIAIVLLVVAGLFWKFNEGRGQGFAKPSAPEKPGASFKSNTASSQEGKRRFQKKEKPDNPTSLFGKKPWEKNSAKAQSLYKVRRYRKDLDDWD